MVQEGYSVQLYCSLLQHSRSGFYAWRKRSAKLISAQELKLYYTAKDVFDKSRESLGSRELMKILCKKSFNIGRTKNRSIMRKLKLIVRQRRAYRVTTQRDLTHAVAPNLVSMNFNPTGSNQVWAGDITYLKTGEGWMYLSIVMGLYSRRIIGWAISSRMTTDLILQSIRQVYWLRTHPQGVIFHSDRGSQYTSKLLKKS